MLRTITTSTNGVFSGITGLAFLVINIYLRIYYLWVRVSTWFLNCILSFILVWWFGLKDVKISIKDFGFLSVQGIRIHWKDNSGLTIEDISFKKIEWNFLKVRDITFLFYIKDLHREIFTDAEDTTTDVYTSFILHWKMHSPRDLISSDLRNSSETVPPSFTLLHATDVQIGSRLHVHRGGAYVALFEADVLDGLLIPSNEATSLCVKMREITYCCGPYDPGLVQARREKILKMPLVDFLGTFYKSGPSQVTMNFNGLQIFVSPCRVNSLVIYFYSWIYQLKEALSSESEGRDETDISPDKSLEVNIKSEDSKVSVCFQDGDEAVNITASFNLSLLQRNKKTQYGASVGIQAHVPSSEGKKDPHAVIGNEWISKPWECSFIGSDSVGHSKVARITSDQNCSVVLRPDSVPVFQKLHEEYISLLDLRRMHDLIGLLKNNKREEQSSSRQVFVSLRGLIVSLEREVCEDLLNVSVDDIRIDFNRDHHHVTVELSVKDLEVEDCADKIIAFQQERSNGISSKSLLRFSLLQDAKNTEERVVVKKLHLEVGDSTVTFQEKLILKLLKFAGIKDKTQLWGEDIKTEQENSNGNPPTTLAATPFYFEKLHVEPFRVVVTCNPAGELSDDLQSLKTSLEIPAGFPPLMENASMQFGEFLRTGITYKTVVAFGRDIRRHYLKEIGRQSTSLLGSLHLLGNLSSLQGDISDGLAELKETGDYFGFVRQVRGGLAESYYKFADSWTAAITQSQSNSPTLSSTSSGSRSISSMRSIGGVVGTLTSYLYSPSKDTGQGKSQASNSSAASTPDTPKRLSAAKRLIPIEYNEDHDSSESEESSLSCIQSVEGWDMVPKDVHRKLKGQEFLERLTASLSGEVDKKQKFISCLRLRYQDPTDKLNALVTNQRVYIMKVGLPAADNVLLSFELVNLYKARHRDQDEEHYLELLMRLAGGKRLSLPSPNPADNPLVRCGTVKIAQNAANVINEAKRSSEEAEWR
ncbi:vacuolar protein sorting-associated protein 13D-like [Stylophora pistillata]|uniref:Vacuolar protein sorting-associated protein 13D n=1 Tax=Stylophora pistillata TaxID=50429 RepID=A0A2B4S122_STYPI|nr:vacuolar protein sorting-associated protein 13D-like [Stylophora pistillata]PFX22267.1 Vacuolar protein sorting-associated protein 13D [Stylophora pistillata]